MSDPSIFGNQNSPEQTPVQNQQQPSGQNDAITTMLASIKAPDGRQKYNSLEDALKALAHSQTFIPQLQQELQTTKDELALKAQEAEKIKELEEAVRKLTTQSTTPEVTPQKVVSPEEIAQIVQQQLNSARTEQQRKENISKVVSKLQEKFGTDAENKFYESAQALGFDKVAANDLAAKSPAAVFRMLGIDAEAKPASGIGGSSINTAGLPASGETFIKSNAKSVLVGATTEDFIEASHNANKMVDELHAQGKSVKDLTNPKVFFSTFGRK